MADAPQAPSRSALASQEATRLELLRRQRDSAAGAAFPVDAGVLNVPFLGNRALELANRGNIELQGAERPAMEERPEGQAAVDRAVGQEGRDNRLASQLQRSRQGQGKEGPKPAEGPSLRQATLAGLSATGAGGAAAAGAANAAQSGAPVDNMKQQIGTAILKTMWQSVWPSFGHTIYVIDLMFLLGRSEYFRKYIPEMGQEWIPPQTRKILPKSAMLPIKLAELTAIVVVTAVAVFIDLLIVILLALIYTIIMSIPH